MDRLHNSWESGFAPPIQGPPAATADAAKPSLGRVPARRPLAPLSALWDYGNLAIKRWNVKPENTLSFEEQRTSVMFW